MPGQAVFADAQKALLERFPLYSTVRLCDLQKNTDLNGQCGIVLPQVCSETDEVPGCLKVRLESGSEVAVRPANLQLATARTDLGILT